MYLIQVDHLVYRREDGGMFTLPEALREVYGCGNAQVLRADRSIAVAYAGHAYAVMHCPTGRMIRRRKALRRS